MVQVPMHFVETKIICCHQESCLRKWHDFFFRYFIYAKISNFLTCYSESLKINKFVKKSIRINKIWYDVSYWIYSAPGPRKWKWKRYPVYSCRLNNIWTKYKLKWAQLQQSHSYMATTTAMKRALIFIREVVSFGENLLIFYHSETCLNRTSLGPPLCSE